MKSKIIKISFLLIFFSFFGLFVGCERVTDIKLLFVVKKVGITCSIDQEQKIKLKLEIFSKKTRNVTVSNLVNTQDGRLWATGVKVVAEELDKDNQITNFDVKVVNSNISLKDIVQGKNGTSIQEFIEKTNRKVTRISSVGDAKESDIFYFKEEPLFLKGKDVQIEFSLETEDSKVFSDTTKLIHLDW